MIVANITFFITIIVIFTLFVLSTEKILFYVGVATIITWIEFIIIYYILELVL